VGIVLEGPMFQIYIFTLHKLPVDQFAATLCQLLKSSVFFLNKVRFTIYFVNMKRFSDFETKVKVAERDLVLFKEDKNESSVPPTATGPQRCLGQLFYLVRCAISPLNISSIILMLISYYFALESSISATPTHPQNLKTMMMMLKVTIITIVITIMIVMKKNHPLHQRPAGRDRWKCPISVLDIAAHPLQALEVVVVMAEL
jgi:hypothetical protein